jgi:MFS family permease
MNKLVVVQAALALLIPAFLLLPHAHARTAFYLLAGLYGLCMGVIMPLLNALLFSASPPLLRGLNTNLGLFTMDMAYFLMPYLGGVLIAFGAGFEHLFTIAAGIALACLMLMILLQRPWSEQP